MRYSRRDFGKLALAGLPAAAMARTFGDARLFAAKLEFTNSADATTLVRRQHTREGWEQIIG